MTRAEHVARAVLTAFFGDPSGFKDMEYGNRKLAARAAEEAMRDGAQEVLFVDITHMKIADAARALRDMRENATTFLCHVDDFLRDGFRGEEAIVPWDNRVTGYERLRVHPSRIVPRGRLYCVTEAS